MWSFYKYYVRKYIKLHQNDSDISQSAFKIYFNLAERIRAKTPLQTGTITFEENGFKIEGDSSLRIQFSDITSLRLEFPHSAACPAHLIEIKYLPNEVLYFGVLRFALFKTFVINNLSRTVLLFDEIKQNVPQDLVWSVLD